MPITDRYLRDPASFPEPGAGEPWGEEELWIDFVGGPYRVSGLSPAQRDRLAAHCAEVCLTGPGAGSRAVEMGVRRLEADCFNPPAPPPRELSFELEAGKTHLHAAGEALCARIDCTEVSRGTLWTCADDEFFTRNVFENFFRILVSYRLLELGGLLLHSAGIVNRDEAFLFPGRSGNGKSTLSRLSLAEGRTVLSDDMNAVTWQDGRARVEKVPFTGDLGRSWSRGADYPMRAIMGIEKAGATFMHDLPATQAMSLLVSCAPFVNADPYRMPKLLENLEQLTRSVPTHILGFALSGGIWDVIEEALQP